ncbi:MULTISPECIES: hypothetical protein [unclassified Sphingomonas]|uniref:hypothetical protein n=1 Tax=unclassified Sphingomonas TaxID=196159 RepID=UPI0006F21427|nr:MULTISPECIES: hypothetical protein [unclassified Sphingomonas]KQN06866.1 hypothetical protein ASE78_14635 [Sphingomonas sp. Leaf25]KQN37077.1 hypothetical protein ASE97_11260 [Sphingomonas sp. Leaf42]KQT30504.1 hypothetical protein ASG37_05345 [Sphingomonas sp. Leaf407]
MAPDLSDDLRRDRLLARRDYAASLMSNSRWRAVLTVLDEARPALQQIRIKFTDSDDIRSMGLPWLHAPHGSVDSFEFGPFPLITIEWIEVPAVAIFPRVDGVAAARQSQDIDAVDTALTTLGRQLPIVRTPEGLRIIGHLR